MMEVLREFFEYHPRGVIKFAWIISPDRTRAVYGSTGTYLFSVPGTLIKSMSQEQPS